MNKGPPPPLAAPVDKAVRQNRTVRAALARLGPADRAHAERAIAAKVFARLRAEGRSQ